MGDELQDDELQDDELLSGRRFFARLHAFDIACPKCDRVYRITRGGHGIPQSGCFDRHTQRFLCGKECGIRLTLALLAWRCTQGPAYPASDSIPLDWRHALELRNLARGVLVDERIPKKAPANRLLTLHCTCVRVIEDPSCPVHRERR